MYDEEILGKMHLLKIDGYSKKKLEGVTFMVFKKADTVINTSIDRYLLETFNDIEDAEKDIINAHKKALNDLYVGTYVTDKDGSFTTEKLMYGDYYVVETNAKEGYYLVKEPVDFKISENDEIVELTIENEGKEGTIDITPSPVHPGNGNGHYPKTGDKTNVKLILIPMLSSILGIFLLKKKNKKIMTLVLSFFVGLSSFHLVGHAMEDITESKTDVYETDDEGSFEFSFEEEKTIDDKTYVLDHITYEKEEQRNLIDGIEINIEKTYEDVKEDFSPKETTDYEGISYVLDSYEIVEGEGKSLFLYYYDETDYVTDFPAHKDYVDYEYTDEETGKKTTVNLPYARTELVDSSYKIPVSFTGTVTGYDAAYIVIGDIKFENPGDDISLTDAELEKLLETINLNPSDFNDISVKYTGNPYEVDGNILRDYEITAFMFGNKYRVYYEGDVEGLAKSYNCKASYKIPEEEFSSFEKVSYKVTATAHYKEKETKKHFLETTRGKVILAGSIIFVLLIITSLALYILKGGRKSTDYKTRRDARRDYKNLTKK